MWPTSWLAMWRRCPADMAAPSPLRQPRSAESRRSPGDRPVLPELCEQRPAAHAEASRRLGLVAAGGRDRPGDQLAFERLAVLAEVPQVIRRRLELGPGARRGPGERRVAREPALVHRNVIGATDDRPPLDHVL